MPSTSNSLLFQGSSTQIRGFVMFAIRRMCRVSEGFKIEVLKLIRQIWTKNSSSIVKKMCNIGLEHWKLKKTVYSFWFKFFDFIPKNSRGFSLENIPYFNFLTKNGWAMSIFKFLLNSETLHNVGSANITNPLRILFQVSKLFLDFG